MGASSSSRKEAAEKETTLSIQGFDVRRQFYRLLKDFVNVHCEVDPKCHVMYTVFATAFIEFAKSRGPSVNMRGFVLKNYIREYLEALAPIDGISFGGCHEEILREEYIVIRGLALKSMPDRKD